MMVPAQVSRLPNGLRVATAALPHAQSVSIGVWVGTGGRHEPDAWSGVSHFIEHLLFKGTKRRSARRISEAIEGRGGDINAFTQEENTCFFARVGAEHAWLALDVLLDMYADPRLDGDDIRRERDVVIDEIQMVHDQPHQRVEELLGELHWPGHPLGRPLTGTAESLRRLGRQELLDYMRRLYVPVNTVVVLAGPLDHEACVRRVAGYLGRRAAGRAARCARVPAGLSPRRFGVEPREIEQAHVALGIRAFGRHDPRRYALKLLSVVLGENMSSRLFQSVRETHGLAYAIQSGAHGFLDVGTLVVSAGLDASRAVRGLQLVARELARLREEPIGRRELGRARDYAVGQLRLGLEGTSNQMMWVGEHLMGYGEVVSPEATIEALQGVTADAIRGVARALFVPEGMSLAMVAPDPGPGAEPGLVGILKRVAG